MQTVTEECRSRNRGTLYHSERRVAFRRRCQSWRCGDCAPKKSAVIQKRLAKVAWTKLITITMPPGRGWARQANIRYQAAHLRSLMRALRRHYGAFKYAWVREVAEVRLECICADSLLDCVCGANGSRLHLHMLLDIPQWIEPRWFKATAKRCGLGFVDLRAVREVSAIRYIAKYLTSGSDSFPFRTRRYQICGVSREPPSDGWSYTRRSIELTIIEIFNQPSVDCGIDFWKGS